MRDKLTKEKYLTIHVRTYFESPIYQRINYDSWLDSTAGPSKQPAKLTDNLGKSYPQVVLDPAILAAQKVYYDPIRDSAKTEMGQKAIPSLPGSTIITSPTDTNPKNS